MSDNEEAPLPEDPDAGRGLSANVTEPAEEQANPGAPADTEQTEPVSTFSEGHSQTDVTSTLPTVTEAREPALATSSKKSVKSSDAPTPECKEAYNAVQEMKGKEAKHAMEAISKAYNHSKICGDCNSRLGDFVGDVVKQLGVRMPRIKNQEDICEHGGTPSDLKTKELGPGSVGWDPRASGGYKSKPSLTSLMMSAEELKDKCRLKDAMIEILADELRDLERAGRWSASGVLRELNCYPNPSPIDFNRAALCRFLNNEPLDGFDDRDEKGREYFATNPLGLTIVRRVGPDSLLVKWRPVADPNVTCYEIFANGLLMQRILSPGRSKTLLHPIDLDKKIILTLNALSYDGEKQESASLTYKK